MLTPVRHFLQRILPKLKSRKRGLSMVLLRKFFFHFFTISIPSLIAVLVVLEIATRLFLSVSDAPDIQFDTNLGNIFIPNQQGVYIKGRGSEIKATFRINNAGWNSPHDYVTNKSRGAYRILVIGDSFIEALQVDYDKSYPYLLEKSLNNIGWGGKSVEVYTFGHSGANLLHYAHILSSVVDNYKPDLVIINIISNDFKESFYNFSRKDNWSLQYENGDFSQEPPVKVSNLPFKKLLRHSALVRYLTVNLDLINTSPLLNKLFYAETRRNEESKIDFPDDIWDQLSEYVLDAYSESSKNEALLLVVDSDREAVYKSQDVRQTQMYKLSSSIKQAAKKTGITVIDLTETFEDSWKEDKKRFDWDIDEHWNEHGHTIIAATITNWIISNLR